jgi:hypothetical protein
MSIMHGRLLILAVILTGCEVQHAAEGPRTPPLAPPATAFDGRHTGSVRGTVRWQGELPAPAGRRFFPTPMLAGTAHATPHLPQVDTMSGGLRDVVVFLRGVDPRAAAPWSHGPVCVEHQGRELVVLQDGRRSRIGFVRRGGTIDIVNRDPHYHALRGRGADFFGIPLPERDVVTRRRLERAGIVELSSGAGFCWMSAHLFVTDHPYFCHSDEQGRFTLDSVPPGTYELVCWLPSWVVLRHERDAEGGQVSRLVLAPPLEQRCTVQVASGDSAAADFTWSLAAAVAK